MQTAKNLTEKALDKAVDAAASAASAGAHAANVGLEKVLNKMDQLGTENVEPSDDVLKYGLGDAPEASRVHRLHAVNAVIHGARRQGQRGGLGYANLSFSSALLHCGATAFLLMGTVLMLEAGQELNVGKAIAGNLLYIFAFACWIARAVCRLVDCSRGDRERAELKPILNRPVREVDLGSSMFGLRITAVVFELVAALLLFGGAVYWFFMDKVSGVAAYVLWLLGSVTLLAAHWVDGRVVGEVWMTSKMLPGHSQRLRAFSERASNSAFQLGSLFFVISAVQWTAWSYRSAQLFLLVASILFIAPCISDVHCAILSSKLQYTDWPTVLAAQVQLDMQSVPTAANVGENHDNPGLPGVMEAVLAPYPTRNDKRYLPGDPESYHTTNVADTLLGRRSPYTTISRIITPNARHEE